MKNESIRAAIRFAGLVLPLVWMSGSLGAQMRSTPRASANAEGSSLASLVVNGVALDDPAPNTRVNLPGTGFVVLNEQIPTSGGITVNMIHVVLQQPVLNLFGGVIGYQTIGNIIVGSATSSVY